MSNQTNQPNGGRFVVATQREVAAFFGRALQTIKGWSAKGMPGGDGAYDLGLIVLWLTAEGPWSRDAAREQEAELLSGNDAESPALERYRAARAETAELDLAERRDELMNREQCRQHLGQWSSILRRFGDRLQRRFGHEAAAMLNDTLAECQAVVDAMGEGGDRD